MLEKDAMSKTGPSRSKHNGLSGNITYIDSS